MPLYFVVKVGRLYAIWKMTPEQMYARVNADPTLKDHLDRAPFKTRTEAEKRRDELNAGSRASAAHN